MELLAYQEDMLGKINDIKSTIKFQMKKILCINVAVGIIAMSDDIPIQNLNMSINSLVSLLKKNKQVIIQRFNEIPTFFAISTNNREFPNDIHEGIKSVGTEPFVLLRAINRLK